MPRETPTFLRDFLLSSGVLKTEGADTAPVDIAEREKARIDWREFTFSLRDFARYIPLIAGNITLIPKEDIPDPVETIEFVIFFPGSVIVQGKEAQPSMTFFFSRRKSGKTEATQRLFSGFALSRSGEVDQREWRKASESASMNIPVATVNTERKPQGRTVDIVFLGVGILHDYYMNLLVGLENTGTVVVENMDGRQELYEASFVRVDEHGRVFRNLVIAGFDPAEDLVDTIGWLNIGYSPVGTALSTTDRLRRFSGTDESLTEMIELRTQESRQRIEAVGTQP